MREKVAHYNETWRFGLSLLAQESELNTLLDLLKGYKQKKEAIDWLKHGPLVHGPVKFLAQQIRQAFLFQLSAEINRRTLE